MIRIEKRSAESFFRYHEFRRADGRGWLDEGETLTGTPGVSVVEAGTGTAHPEMASEAAVYSQTAVRYRLAGGTPGSYFVTITVETSGGQVFEDRLILAVR